MSSIDQSGAVPLFFPVIDEAGLAIWDGPVRIFMANASANGNASTVWLQFYDANDPLDVTPGTDVKLSIPIPAGAVWDTPQTKPTAFSVGIVALAASTATGAGAPSGDVTLSVTVEGDGKPLNV